MVHEYITYSLGILLLDFSISVSFRVGISLYFILHRVCSVSWLVLLQVRCLSIYPYTHIPIPGTRKSMLPSRAVQTPHDLSAIKHGHISMACLASWYTSSSRVRWFTSCFLRDFSRIWSVFILRMYMWHPLSNFASYYEALRTVYIGVVQVQVGHFSHRKGPESIISYQYFMFTWFNPFVSAHLVSSSLRY